MYYFLGSPKRNATTLARFFFNASSDAHGWLLYEVLRNNSERILRCTWLKETSDNNEQMTGNFLNISENFRIFLNAQCTPGAMSSVLQVWIESPLLYCFIVLLLHFKFFQLSWILFRRRRHWWRCKGLANLCEVSINFHQPFNVIKCYSSAEYSFYPSYVDIYDA